MESTSSSSKPLLPAVGQYDDASKFIIGLAAVTPDVSPMMTTLPTISSTFASATSTLTGATLGTTMTPIDAITVHNDSIFRRTSLTEADFDDDTNFPSGSYFTGDEEIPVWNVGGDVRPLLLPNNSGLLELFGHFHSATSHPVSRQSTLQPRTGGSTTALPSGTTSGPLRPA